MNAVSLENKTILVTGECEIIRGCHNRDKGTAENERLRGPKFIFSYPESERKTRKYGTFGRHKEGRYATADRENLLAVRRESRRKSFKTDF